MIIDTEKMFVPNWFDKEWLEGEIGEELFDYQWEDFMSFATDRGIEDRVSEIMSQFVRDNDIHELLRPEEA